MPALQKPQKLILLLVVSVQRVTLGVEGGIELSLPVGCMSSLTLSTDLSWCAQRAQGSSPQTPGDCPSVYWFNEGKKQIIAAITLS